MARTAHNPAYAAVRALLKPLLDRRIAIRAEGVAEVPATGPALLVCNHRSVVDPFVISSALPRQVQFVAAAWMGAVPGLNALLAQMGIVILPPADRTGGLIRLGQQQLARGALLGIFPEGEPPTLAKRPPRALAPFHRGAARLVLDAGIPDLPVVPAAFVTAGDRVALRIPGEWLKRLEPDNPLYQDAPLELMAYDAVTVRFARPLIFDFPQLSQGARRDRAVEAITAHLEKAVGALLA